MTKFLLTAYLAALHIALLLAVREIRHADQRAAADHAATLAHGVRRAAQAPASIAVVGDSRVQDLAVSLLPGPAENYGIGSETIDDVTARLPLYRFDRARAVVLEPGLNDWWANGFSGFETRYRRLLASVPPSTPVVAAGVVGIDATAAHARWRGLPERLAGINRIIEALCRARPRCTYAPPFATRLTTADHVGDGVHLSSAGNRKLAASLAAALARL